MEVYSYGNTVFVLQGSKVYIKTRLQTFYLLPDQSYYYKRLDVLRLLIRLGKIQSIEDVLTYSRGRVKLVCTNAKI